MKKFLMERYITGNGKHYTGYIKIESVKLECNVVFDAEVSEIYMIGKDFHHLVEITINHQTLTMEEYQFFHLVFVQPIIDFIGGKIGDSNFKIEVKNQYHFSDELCKMLSAPKFGCVFDTK